MVACSLGRDSCHKQGAGVTRGPMPLRLSLTSVCLSEAARTQGSLILAGPGQLPPLSDGIRGVHTRSSHCSTCHYQAGSAFTLPQLQAKKRKAGPGVTEAERGAAESQDEDSDEEGIEQAALD